MGHIHNLSLCGWVLVIAGALCGLLALGLCWYRAKYFDFQLGPVDGDDATPRSFPTSPLGRLAPAPEEIGAGAKTSTVESECLP